MKGDLLQSMGVLKCMEIWRNESHFALLSSLQNASHDELKYAFHFLTPILHGWIKYYGYFLQGVNSVEKMHRRFFSARLASTQDFL